MRTKTLKRKNGELFVKIHDDGTKQHIPLKNGLEHGKLKTWYPSGQLKEQACYQYGQQHGTHSAWHPNGQKAHQAQFENGTRVGWFYKWHENGALASSMYFDKNGKANGIAKIFNENGEETTASYHLHGKRKHYKIEEIDFMIHFLSNHNFNIELSPALAGLQQTALNSH